MRRSELDLAIGSLALGLEPGAVLREYCPQCGGGQSKEKSLGLGLSEEGYLWWKCHRASCGLSGKKLAWGAIHAASNVKKPPRGFTGALEALHAEHLEALLGKFGIWAPDNWRWAAESARIYMPILGPDWKHRGAILRNLPDDTRQPKTLTFKLETDDPWMHWMDSPDSHEYSPVVVEDMFSAAKLQQSGVPAVCILGTHLGLDKVREILQHKDGAILALDKDATSKAVQYAVQYKHLVNFEVWQLDRDLKYETEERIREAYFERKTDFGRI